MGNLCCKDQGSVKDVFQIISLGKAGSGKSHTGNTIFGVPNMFKTECSPASVTEECVSKTATVNGRPITYIDTPGFFNIGSPKQNLKSEILRSIIKCSEGPHAFLIILKVEPYTAQEVKIVKQIRHTFGEETFKYSIVLFTHGNNLDKDETIEQFVSKNPELQRLVEACGGRCHVIDNKSWNRRKRGDRSNKVQVEKLFNTIEKMVNENGGGRYTNEMLQYVRREMQETEDKIERESKGRLSEDQIRAEAEERMHIKLLVRFAGVATGILLGALLGIITCIAYVKKNIGFDAVIGAVQQTVSGGNALIAAAVAAGAAVVAGAVVGGVAAYDAVEGQQTVQGAVKEAANACKEKAEQCKKRLNI